MVWNQRTRKAPESLDVTSMTQDSKSRPGSRKLQLPVDLGFKEVEDPNMVGILSNHVPRKSRTIIL